MSLKRTEVISAELHIGISFTRANGSMSGCSNVASELASQFRYNAAPNVDEWRGCNGSQSSSFERLVMPGNR